MADIQMFFSNDGDRNEVRMRVVNELAKEKPGKGSGTLATKYNYFVETLKDGKHIILTRPANLHNGFDFVVRVEDIDFNLGKGRYRDNPTHDDILNDLNTKKQENPKIYEKLYNYITETFNCKEIQEQWFDALNFELGYPSEMIVKTIKWLFIEQDIRYWNYSGREMFMRGFPSP